MIVVGWFVQAFTGRPRVSLRCGMCVHSVILRIELSLKAESWSEPPKRAYFLVVALWQALQLKLAKLIWSSYCGASGCARRRSRSHDLMRPDTTSRSLCSHCSSLFFFLTRIKQATMFQPPNTLQVSLFIALSLSLYLFFLSSIFWTKLARPETLSASPSFLRQFAFCRPRASFVNNKSNKNDANNDSGSIVEALQTSSG